MRKHYALDEQETHICVMPKVVSKDAEIFSCIPTMMDRLSKLYTEHADEMMLVEGDGFVKATVPASWIKVSPKRKSVMTEEQRRAAAERLASYRKARGVKKT